MSSNARSLSGMRLRLFIAFKSPTIRGYHCLQFIMLRGVSLLLNHVIEIPSIIRSLPLLIQEPTT